MNGVEILNQTTIYETVSYPWIIAIGAAIGLLISLIIAIVSWIKNGFDPMDFLIIGYASIAGAMLGGIIYCATMHESDVVDYTKYQVTIAEDVNFVEFNNKYEILDQEGKIYTVKEKE